VLKLQAGDGATRMPVEIAVPVFGYKSHLNIDRRHGLIRGWTVTDAAAHDSRSFTDLLEEANTASPVWADTAYRTRRNLSALQRRGLSERLQFRRPPHRSLSGPGAKANAARARVRSAIEARLRPPEASHGAVHSYHRFGASTGEDRACKPSLQFYPARVARHPNCPCVAAIARRTESVPLAAPAQRRSMPAVTPS
jgi:IS5 family transposase